MDIKNFTRYSAGQYVFLYLPLINPFQLHPFSLVSVPERGSTASVIIEVQKGWTSSLKKSIIKGNSFKHVWIDGPYGKVDIPFFERTPFVVLIAGGVGITPALSLLQGIRHTKTPIPSRVHLIWTCRNQALFTEFAQEVGSILKDTDNVSLALQVYHTGESEQNVALEEATAYTSAFYSAFKAERADFKVIFDDIANDAFMYNAHHVGVFVCGSKRLRNGVIRNAIVRKNCVFDVHQEGFTQ